MHESSNDPVICAVYMLYAVYAVYIVLSPNCPRLEPNTHDLISVQVWQ